MVALSIGGTIFVKLDDTATSYFQTQEKLTLKQARRQEFFTDFDLSLEYKIAKTNVVVDVLKREVEVVSTRVQISEAQVDDTLLASIHVGMWQDVMYNS